MSVRNNRLEDYQMTQLFPADIIEASKNKTLPISLYFFKIGRFFSFEDIGNFKMLQKQHEKDLCANLYYSKKYNELTFEQQVDLKKILNKRASSPTRESPYIKFLVKSILKSAQLDVCFASYEQEINESWCFEVYGSKYDLTLNKNKFPKDNQVFIESSQVLDQKGMLRKDAVLKVMSFFPFEVNVEKLHELNSILNDQREKMVFLYGYKEESQVIDINLASRSITDSKK